MTTSTEPTPLPTAQSLAAKTAELQRMSEQGQRLQQNLQQALFQHNHMVTEQESQRKSALEEFGTDDVAELERKMREMWDQIVNDTAQLQANLNEHERAVNAFQAALNAASATASDAAALK